MECDMYKVRLRKTIEYVAYVHGDDEEAAYENAIDAIEGNQSWVNWEEKWHEYDCRDVELEERDPDYEREDRDCHLFKELHG